MDEPEEVVGEHERTHSEMSPEAERAERLEGFIDAKGRRLPAGLLFLLLSVIAIFAWGMVMIFRPH